MKKRANYNLIIGAIITTVMLIFMLTGLFFTPHDPNAMNADFRFAGPSLTYIFGNDNFGRDLLSRVMTGSLNTLYVAVLTVFVGTFFGVIIGGLTGYFGGIFDEIIMRINDTVFAFPSILLALVIVSVLGNGRSNVILALGIAFIPSFARLVRAEFLKYKKMDFVVSAHAGGIKDMRIIFVHILPNTYTVLIPAIMIGFNNAVLAEAGMSYLGIGVMPPDASLGRMLSESQTYLQSAPAMVLAPGIVLILIVLGFSLLSDGLRTRA